MNPWLILLGLGVMVWFWLSGRRRVGAQRGVLSFGKSRAREVTNESITFDDVAGVDEAAEELTEVVDFLRKPDRYTRIGARIPKGVLLVGPPGTGKTLLARAVAGEAGVPFFQLSGSDFVEMFVGVGASRVRDMFDKARKAAPCIVFIDEIDALGRARGAGALSHEEREQTLNQLLAEMDGFDPSAGVIMLAATNRPEVLDSALLRAGRFDRQVLVDLPDKEGRRAILAIHVRGVKLAKEIDLDAVAASTPGLAGADLANLINEAALLTARAKKPEVTMVEFEEAIQRAFIGLEKKGRIRSVEEQKAVAYHELGHAVVATLLPDHSPVGKVTIIQRGVSGGVTMFLPREEANLYKASQLRDMIAASLGGRAAELLFIGEPTTGAAADLVQATQLASDMVRKFGMSRLGSRTYEQARAAVVNAEMMGAPRDHGESTAGQIDGEVNRIVDGELARATKILEEQRAAVEVLAERLVEAKQLSGREVREALGVPEPEPVTAAQPAGASSTNGAGVVSTSTVTDNGNDANAPEPDPSPAA